MVLFMNKVGVLFLFFFLSVFMLHSQNDPERYSPDCSRFEAFRDRYSEELLLEYYPFIQYNRNYFELNSSRTLESFFTLLKQSEQKKVRILHIGDSHVHSDIFTGYVRKRLQSVFGSGGRGLMFPYCTAGTHATRDYITKCTGNWTSSKTTEKVLLYDIGVTGVTARTNDVNATASIIIKPGEYKIEKKPVSISLLYLPGQGTFDVTVSSGQNEWRNIQVDSEKGVIRGILDWASDTLTIAFSRRDSTQNYFELYGILTEYAGQPGLVYNSAGINGAAIQHLLNQKLIEKHIAVINPDLIILDLGTNDIYRGVLNEQVMHKILVTIIQRIRKTLPDVCILLMPPQDMYFRKKHVVPTEKFAELMAGTAVEGRCAFYNYFSVSGGNYSMLKWEKSFLAKHDRIHLTNEGYFLKGRLFVIAFLDAYLKYAKSDEKEFNNLSSTYDSTCVSLWFSDVSVYNSPIDTIGQKDVEDQDVAQISDAGNRKIHLVKKGENLGVIAQNYGVQVSQLKKWNNLSGSIIYPGQKLIVKNYEQVKTDVQINDTYSETNNDKSQSISYVVKKGDTLYSISKTYGVSVDNIKKWNNLTSDLIQPGQKLIIHR